MTDLTDKDFNDVTANYFSKTSERIQRNREEEDEEEFKITMLFRFLFFLTVVKLGSIALLCSMLIAVQLNNSG